MKGFLDKLNLKPLEKRLLVVTMIVLFVVINMWFVRPHFSDWGRVQFRMAKARRTLAAFETEISQMPTYQAKVRELGSDNYAVPIEEQALHFNNTRESVASQAGVTIGTTSRVITTTNQFFLELNQTINLLCKEPELVNFLYNLGSGNSLIRVRDLSLKPDGPRQQLNATVKLAASYQKKPSGKPAGTAATQLTQTTGTKTAPASISSKTQPPIGKPTPSAANTPASNLKKP